MDGNAAIVVKPVAVKPLLKFYWIFWIFNSKIDVRAVYERKRFSISNDSYFHFHISHILDLDSIRLVNWFAEFGRLSVFSHNTAICTLCKNWLLKWCQMNACLTLVCSCREKHLIGSPAPLHMHRVLPKPSTSFSSERQKTQAQQIAVLLCFCILLV